MTQGKRTLTLSYSPPPEFNDAYPPHPGSNDQPPLSPGFHDQSRSDNLYFILDVETIYRCMWAPVNHSLVFVVEPSPSLQYRHPLVSKIQTPNREPYALVPGDITNAAYLENESRLCKILAALRWQCACDFRDCLLARVYKGLVLMECHKQLEWNHQWAGSIARYHGHSVVNTGMWNVLVFL